MPIRLGPPAYKPGGPDGKGWNRLSLNAHVGTTSPQCALRPRSYPQLWESQDTRRARWGGWGRCVRPDETNNPCDGCPVLGRKPRELHSFEPRVLVRIKEGMPGPLGQSTQPWVMNRPDDGWGEYGEPWTWDDLARLQGWQLGDQYWDEHGEGFWLIATSKQHGIYGVTA